MQTTDKIAIIGGGIGGLTMALTLKKNNHDFKLFEKSSEFKEVGAGIGIASNALKIFDKLNVGEKIREKGHLLKKTVLATEKLKTLKTVPFPEEVYCIHRASIIDTLANELDKDSYKLNKEVESVENEESIKIKFKDNTFSEFDTLIASDGINSTIRKSVFPEIGIRPAHQVIWRGITKFDINADLKHTYYELFEGSLRFLFLPLNDNEMFWLAVQEKKNFSKGSTTSIKHYLLDTYSDFHPIVLDLLNKTSESDILQNELADIEPKYKGWFKNNPVFIGDSIHATTPNLGQGACQAIEDAYTLGLCLKSNTSNTFSEYQNIRSKKVEYIVKQSWKIGKMSLTKNRLQKTLLHLLLKYFPKRQYQKRFSRVIDIEYLDELENTATNSL
ncbi:FAD-dependent monooxygenase [Flavivirga spongiicola]|uniref:FAD-dependent monooxygenase n=1 Tax=Flavivirga spongiicola TaxID=421621 RepID=A0ABU7XSK0_9FLAO|nr:FAD-dependent monooxygenase [Flavivirga sp. MEBiC05379]MDO5978566.1 FAD-dependent monooxygenase [Flavivirga sp. MEBiC05379]